MGVGGKYNLLYPPRDKVQIFKLNAAIEILKKYRGRGKHTKPCVSPCGMAQESNGIMKLRIRRHPLSTEQWSWREALRLSRLGAQCTITLKNSLFLY